MRIIKRLLDLNEDTYKLLKESSLTMDMDFMVKATSKDREIALAILTLVDCLKSSKSFVEYQEGMRLLDANELRTQFSSDEIYGPEEIKCIIDNAPTVEGLSVIEFKEPLPFVKAQKIVKTLSKRPEGVCEKCKFNHSEICDTCSRKYSDNFCGEDVKKGCSE